MQATLCRLGWRGASPGRLVASVWMGSLAVAISLALAGPASALSIAEARHLLTRTGFGATAAEIDRLRPLTRDEAVDLLIGEAALPAASAQLPDWADRNPMTIRNLDDPAVADALLQDQGEALKAWWIDRLLWSPVPLRERMTLFWHGHFATALSKVRSPQLMLRQNRMLRRHAMGNFAALLTDVTLDPAMLLYLDAQTSVSAAPNENLARELLELFTLGVGHYSEDDVRAAARALTGWVVLPATGDVMFVAGRHDPGDKTLLGQSGPWDREAVIRILLEQPQTARFIASALWSDFVSLPPESGDLDALAGQFRQDYAIAPLLRSILLSEAFWAPGERGALIAGPVEWTVGTLRLLAAEDAPAAPIAALTASLGQDLFEPPNVAGWTGGVAWITPATLAGRLGAIMRFVAGRRDSAPATAPSSRRSAALVRWLDGLPYAWRSPDRLQALVLPQAPVGARGAALPSANSPDPEVLADLVRGWLVDPVFQLR